MWISIQLRLIAIKNHFSNDVGTQKAFSLVELSIVILIIGVLIAAIGQGLDLLQDSKLTAARMITQSSRVASINKLSLWLDTTSANSFSSSATEPDDGQSISTWYDISPQNRDKITFTQNTGANQPTYKLKGINSLPSINFNGSTYLTNSTIAPITARNSTYTMAIVFQSNNPSSNSAIFSQGNNLCYGNAQFAVTSNYQGFSGGCNDSNITTPVYLGVNYASLLQVNNNNTNNISLYSNSLTPSITATGPAGNPGSNPGSNNTHLSVTTNETSIGCSAVVHNAVFNGLVSEIIIIDGVVSNNDIKAIMKYFSKKYNVTLR